MHACSIDAKSRSSAPAFLAHCRSSAARPARRDAVRGRRAGRWSCVHRRRARAQGRSRRGRRRLHGPQRSHVNAPQALLADLAVRTRVTGMSFLGVRRSRLRVRRALARRAVRQSSASGRRSCGWSPKTRASTTRRERCWRLTCSRRRAAGCTSAGSRATSSSAFWSRRRPRFWSKQSGEHEGNIGLLKRRKMRTIADNCVQ